MGEILGHNHNHDHGSATGWVLRVSLVVTLGFTAFEVIAGLRSSSLALLSDAGHNFTDAIALLLAAIGAYMQVKPANQNKTFGYQRAGVLAAFINALTLVLISLGIFWEAISRFMKPEPVDSQTMLVVAAIGMVVNLIIAMWLAKGRKDDINMRAAFIHMIGDAVSAFAVILGAIAIRYTGWVYIDPILSVIIGVLILASAWDVIRESSDILLEGMPRGIELGEVTARMMQISGVLGVHDLHIWTLGSKTHALSSHVLIDDVPPSESDLILRKLNDELMKFGICHTTIQFEHCPCNLFDHGCNINEAAHRLAHQHES